MPERQDSLWIDEIKEAIARVEEYTVGICGVMPAVLTFGSFRDP